MLDSENIISFDINDIKDFTDEDRDNLNILRDKFITAEQKYMKISDEMNDYINKMQEIISKYTDSTTKLESYIEEKDKAIQGGDIFNTVHIITPEQTDEVEEVKTKRGRKKKVVEEPKEEEPKPKTRGRKKKVIIEEENNSDDSTSNNSDDD